MTTPTYTPTDIVNFAMNKDAVNISNAFDQMINQRVYDAIQARKIEVAKSMFGQEDTIEDEEEEQQEVENETENEMVAVGVGDETNTESEESNENAEQSA
jgi:hypothetical protein